MSVDEGGAVLNMDEMRETFGEPISCYSREQAIEDGVLVDLTEWASADKGFLGGFHCPVAMTQALWMRVEIGEKGRAAMRGESTRGRAHDVLWMASLALRSAMKAGRYGGLFRVIVTPPDKIRKPHDRLRTLTLRVVADGDGVTIGFPDDF